MLKPTIYTNHGEQTITMPNTGIEINVHAKRLKDRIEHWEESYSRWNTEVWVGIDHDGIVFMYSHEPKWFDDGHSAEFIPHDDNKRMAILGEVLDLSQLKCHDIKTLKFKMNFPHII